MHRTSTTQLDALEHARFLLRWRALHLKLVLLKHLEDVAHQRVGDWGMLTRREHPRQ